MRNAGGAHRGLDLWLAQRASALVMAVFLPGFLVYSLAAAPFDHARWSALFAPLAAKIACLLFTAALLTHALIGVREVLIDYVPRLGVRLAVDGLITLLYLGCFVWAADILWTLA